VRWSHAYATSSGIKNSFDASAARTAYATSRVESSQQTAQLLQQLCDLRDENAALRKCSAASEEELIRTENHANAIRRELEALKGSGGSHSPVSPSSTAEFKRIYGELENSRTKIWESEEHAKASDRAYLSEKRNAQEAEMKWTKERERHREVERQGEEQMQLLESNRRDVQRNLTQMREQHETSEAARRSEGEAHQRRQRELESDLERCKEEVADAQRQVKNEKSMKMALQMELEGLIDLEKNKFSEALRTITNVEAKSVEEKRRHEAFEHDQERKHRLELEDVFRTAKKYEAELVEARGLIGNLENALVAEKSKTKRAVQLLQAGKASAEASVEAAHEWAQEATRIHCVQLGARVLLRARSAVNTSRCRWPVTQWRMHAALTLFRYKMSEMVVKNFQGQLDHVERGVIKGEKIIEAMIRREQELGQETTTSLMRNKQLHNEMQQIITEKTAVEKKCLILEAEGAKLREKVHDCLMEIRVNDTVHQMANARIME